MSELRVYMTRAEKGKLIEISKKTGISMSKLLLKGFDYWVRKNPKELKEVAKEFHNIELEREAKERERDSGDLLGSFQKKRDKIAWIRRAFADHDLTKAEKDRMIEETEQDYKLTAEIKKRRILHPNVNPKEETNDAEPYERNLFDWCKKCSKDCRYCRHYNIKEKKMSQNRALRLEHLAIKNGLFL